MDLAKHSYPLTSQNTMLHNIVNGQVAPIEVNVQAVLSIRDSIATFFTIKGNNVVLPLSLLDTLKVITNKYNVP